MKDRNILRCPKCGFAIYTSASQRECAKCNNGTKMIFEGKENV